MDYNFNIDENLNVFVPKSSILIVVNKIIIIDNKKCICYYDEKINSLSRVVEGRGPMKPGSLLNQGANSRGEFR